MEKDSAGIELSSAAPRRALARAPLLLPGESAVASVGIAVALILIGAMSASAWWSAKAQRRALAEARAGQIEAVSALLTQSGETMLGAGELSAIRRLVADAGQRYGLTECRIMLADGQVIADAEPLKITAHQLPVEWPAARQDQRQAVFEATGSKVTSATPLFVPGGGTAVLRIAAPVQYPRSSHWDTQAGVGLIAAASMAALLVVYRQTRKRLRAIGAIREALLALERGETAKAALAVNEALGAEAEAWNELLAEREKLRHTAVVEQARQSLGNRREARGDLDSLCDAMSQGLLLVDEKKVIKYANGAAAVFLRTSREDLAQSQVHEVLDDPRVLEAVEAVTGGGSRRRSTIEVERDESQGGGVLRFNVRPLRREDSAAAMVQIEDITQQRVADAARNSFVATATHELRAPLTNIRIYVETALDEGERDPALRSRCINVINTEARRLERIVSDMLSVSEIEAGSMKLKEDDVRTDALFEELKHDYAASAEEKKITLSFNLPPKMPVIHGDRDKLAMAMHNLLSNAIKYTEAGGKVTVNVEASADEVTVDVTDTGIGMSEADAEHVFEKFYRAKDQRVAKITGTGLGLALAREVVRLHGGDITVKSELNKGSTFTMTLPAVVEAV